MKKKLLNITLIIFSPAFFPQEIKWENFSGGISINYLITEGDLKSHWNNTPEAGLFLNYFLESGLSLEGSITGAFFSPKAGKNEELPDIFLISMPAGLKYSLTSGSYSVHLSAGLTNSTFIFSGKAAEILKENNTESEFGFFLSGGFSRKISEDFTLEIAPSFQQIFSTPNLNIYRLGLKLIYDI